LTECSYSLLGLRKINMKEREEVGMVGLESGLAVNYYVES